MLGVRNESMNEKRKSFLYVVQACEAVRFQPGSVSAPGSCGHRWRRPPVASSNVHLYLPLNSG